MPSVKTSEKARTGLFDTFNTAALFMGAFTAANTCIMKMVLIGAEMAGPHLHVPESMDDPNIRYAFGAACGAGIILTSLKIGSGVTRHYIDNAAKRAASHKPSGPNR